MAKFIYNNTKNASTGHISFELNYNYHSYILFEKDANPCFKSKLVDKLSIKL